MTIELGMGLMFLILIGASFLWLVDQLRLKSCPYCRKRISYGAVKCPYCQSNLNSDPEEDKEPVRRPGAFAQTPAEINETLAHQMAHRRARLAAEAERRASEISDRNMRRAKRDAAYRARGIEPGPLAWFQALPDIVQAILMGFALVALIGAGLLVLAAMASFLAPR